MTTRHIGRVALGCLAVGPVAALALVLGPAGGAEDHVITGAVLLAFGSSWALLATLSARWTTTPQRWAVIPAVSLAVPGAALLAFGPDADAMDALGWIWPPLLIAMVAVTAVRVRRHLHGRARNWIVYPVLGLYGLAAAAGGSHTILESIDRRNLAAPGQLIDVGGHRLHLVCEGSGTPTVVLEAGLGATAASWIRVSTSVARETRVCAYDRAGRGWSDPSVGANDGVTVATGLHVLLERANVSGPFVMVGHSSGANYVRIFTGRYPEQVAGMVLVDGQPAEAFEGLPAFPSFYSWFRRIFALLPSLARLGVGRIVSHGAYDDLPEPARSMEKTSHSSARLWRSLRDEFVELPTSLQQARSFQSIGNRPLVVVTAAIDNQPGWQPLQEEMSKLSTNTSHRVVPCTHDALVSDEACAQISSRAIRDVVHAVRSGVSFKK